ncbi:MAG: hypothetical protein IKN96_03370 [Oscillibacter sp.]|nr:hypothetical protein [Oscillibacter sp.]
MDIRLRLQDYWKTLSDASYDSNAKASLIDSPHKAYKLDGVTAKVCQKLRGGMTLSGCDAYLKNNGVHWFIEFKNQEPKDIDPEDIRKKAYDSVSTVRMAVDQTITLDNLCQNAVFLVVYRDEEPATEDAIERKTAEFAGMRHIRWKLGQIEGKLYREVHTIPVTKFREEWIPRIWGGEI